MNIRVEPDRKRVVVLHGTRLLGELVYQIQSITTWLESVTFDHRGASVRVQLTGAEIEDVFEMNDDCVTIGRTWRFDVDGQYRLTFDYRLLEPELSSWVMPANRYTEPPPERVDMPRGGLRAGWAFDERRMPFPAVVFYGADRHQWVALSPAAVGDEPAGFKSYLSERLPAVQIGMPVWEEPRALTGPVGASGSVPQTRWLPVGGRTAPREFRRTVTLGTGDGHTVGRVFGRLHRLAWESDGQTFEPDWPQVIRAKMRLLRSSLASRRGHGTVGVRLPRRKRGERVLVSAGPPTSSLAAADAISGWAGRDQAAHGRDEALEICRFFTEGRIRDGALADAFDVADGWISLEPGRLEPVVGAMNLRNAATAMLAMIDVYERYRERRQTHPELIRAAAELGDLAVRNQQRDGFAEGAYPGMVSLVRSGPGSEHTAADGALEGAVCVSLLAALERCRGRNAIRAASLKRASLFYRRLSEEPVLRRADGDADRGDALDLLRALIDLYELRGESADLQAAEIATGHLLGWVWAYSIPVSARGGSRPVHTQGLAAPGVDRKHLDFEGWPIARELLRLHRASGDAYYERVGIAVLNASAQLVSGVDLRVRRGRGWQPAELDHTDWSGIRRFGRRPGDYGGERIGSCPRGLRALLQIAHERPDLIPSVADYPMPNSASSRS